MLPQLSGPDPLQTRGAFHDWGELKIVSALDTLCHVKILLISNQGSPVVDVQLGSPSGFNFYLPVDSEPGTEVVITGRVAPGRAGELTCFLHFLFTISKDLLENITCSRRPLDQCLVLEDLHAFPHPLGKPWLCSLSYQLNFYPFPSPYSPCRTRLHCKSLHPLPSPCNAKRTFS